MQNTIPQQIDPFQQWLKERCIWIEECYDGRVNRLKYFLIILLIAFVARIAAVGAVLAPQFLRVEPTSLLSSAVIGLLVFLIWLATFVVSSAWITKRLHDIGRPGFHFWLLLIPLYNIYLQLVLLFRKGTEGANPYGPDPLYKSA